MTNPSTPELRQAWLAYWLMVENDILEPWRARGCPLPVPKLPPLPDELRGLTCGAKTRAGAPCRRRDLAYNGRCRLHGGMSTGPKTTAGKQRSARNLRLPKEPQTP